MSYRLTLLTVLLCITACNETESPRQQIKQSSSGQHPSTPSLFINGEIIWHLVTAENAPQLRSQITGAFRYTAINPDDNALIVSLDGTSNNDQTNRLIDYIARSGCALYSVSTLGGEEQCVAPNIFAELPENSPDSPLGFDRAGNLLVIGRRFVTSHTDTCLQPTPSGCAAWQVDYAIELEDEEPQLYRIKDGLPQLIYTGTDNKVLAGFASMDTSLHVLSATYAGFALNTHLLRIDEATQHITDLGGASALLPAANGLLFVDQVSALQFSTAKGLSKLPLPSMAPAADYWFNPAPQALAFDGQGQLYGLFQQRRLLQDGTWQDYLLSYRLLPYQATLVAESEVSAGFFTTSLPLRFPVTTAYGYAVLDCHNAACDLLVQHNSQLRSIALPDAFSPGKLLVAQNNIILDGHTSAGQLMQLQYGFNEYDEVTTSSTLFPVEWQSVITIPAAQAIPPADDLKITSSTLAEHSLSLSFNQAPACLPSAITLYKADETADGFNGSYLLQGASLHLLNVRDISALDILFECSGSTLLLQQNIPEDSLAN